MASLLKFININITPTMKTFKQYNEATTKYIGKTVVYATRDTSGGGETSFKKKSKVVKHDKKFNVLTLADGTKVNTVVHQRKDKKLYNKRDFYVESIMSEQKTIKVGEDAIGTDKTVHYAVVKERKVIATGSKDEMLAKCEKVGGRVWKTSSTVGDIVESLQIEDMEPILEGFAVDTSPWQFSHGGVPKGKGNWAFDYVASLASGGVSGLQKDTFFAKAQSTYRNAVKQLVKFLKKDLKVKPNAVKIKLAP